MTMRLGGVGKLAAMSLAIAAMVAVPLSASAHDGRGGHDGYRGGGYGHYDNYRGDYGRHGGGGHWSGGRWIAGAIVTGAVLGLVSNAFRPEPVYYPQQEVYSRPTRVIYDDYPPVVVRRVYETRTVYSDDGYRTRYVRHEDDDDD